MKVTEWVEFTKEGICLAITFAGYMKSMRSDGSSLMEFTV